MDELVILSDIKVSLVFIRAANILYSNVKSKPHRFQDKMGTFLPWGIFTRLLTSTAGKWAKKP
ncbi:MAG: hypothetical protein CO189_04750 [candidate division Zixibacteria bacterium CG_4_9_14_3_um_filter_46_8]|nr:MAG: hypothetical protein CO189_04750 [candidate division Zixibacteria bacterium CG_4_9_14_3_um_filter_46_8]